MFSLIRKVTSRLLRLPLRIYNYYIWKKKHPPTIIYFRSAKTGSTSIINSLRSSFFSVIEIRKVEDIIKIRSASSIIIVSVAAKPSSELYGKILKNLEQLSPSASFAVVRNPYTKILSSYKYIDSKGQSLVEMLNSPPQDNYRYSHFTRSQSDALFYQSKLVPNNLLRFENLNNEIDGFFRKLGYQISSLPSLNSTNKKKAPKLDEKVKKMIVDKYAEDFKNFGYSVS